MDALLVGILLPHIIVRTHIDALQAIPGNDVELPDGVVIFRRITCGHHDPAVRDTMPTKDFVLQELQHSRSKGLGHTVDLIQEQNALF